MSRNYLANVLTPEVTPQSQPLPGKSQMKNSAGGFVFETGVWAQLDRWLILGSEKGTYYVSERKLTLDNIKCVEKALEENPGRLIKTAVDISLAGRAPSNDPALFVLAYAFAHGKPEVRDMVSDALPKVARIGTHLFHFLEIFDKMHSWGRKARHMVGNWYLSQEESKLAYSLIKYQARDGWSHRDALRLAHQKPTNDAYDFLFAWAAGKAREDLGLVDINEYQDYAAPVLAFEKAKALEVGNKGARKELIGLITDYNLPRECVPTEWLNDPAIWEALLVKMPLMAMVRNLGKMTSIGLIADNSDATIKVVKSLADVEQLRKSRIHPVQLLLAGITYGTGHGLKGKLSWNAVRSVMTALDKAFYDSFKVTKSSGKRFYLGLDVSGSMGSQISCAPMSCLQASVAMALVTMNVEDFCDVRMFSDGTNHYGRSSMFGHGSSAVRSTSKDLLAPAPITVGMTLPQAVERMSGMSFGGTDCALPMVDALARKVKVDCFVTYTDNETWAGSIHPSKALEKYRQGMGIDAKLVTVGMTSTGFSICDPNDAGSVDVVGFDANTPSFISNFAAGQSEAVDEDEVEVTE